VFESVGTAIGLGLEPPPARLPTSAPSKTLEPIAIKIMIRLVRSIPPFIPLLCSRVSLTVRQTNERCGPRVRGVGFNCNGEPTDRVAVVTPREHISYAPLRRLHYARWRDSDARAIGETSDARPQENERNEIVKLAMQTGRLPGDSLDEKFAVAAAAGFDAIEVNAGPSFDVRERLGDLLAARDRSGLPICAICTHPIHDPLLPDSSERAVRLQGLTTLLALADELGAAGVVSVPVRPPHTFADGTDLDALAVDALGAWAATLPAGNAALFLEPLNRYEAFYMRRVEQAASVSRAIGHPRVKALADLFHMNIEEANMAEPIFSAGSELGHVHIADNNRLQPGAGCLDFRTPFRALKQIGYTGYVTIECSALGGPLADQGVPAMLAESVRFLRREWDAA
jgi:sugar phosphate isomerase/epimerase